MIRSMTGFGAADGVVGPLRVEVEVRSVNHRFFSPSMRLPAAFARWESDVRDALRAHVADRLPEYMVPAVVLVLDGPLPLTPNGKLDQRALPAPDWSAPAGSRRPSTARERRLADLFAEVLDLPEVGVDDGFFDLGGHSMAVMRLIGRVRTELGADLTVREVFDALQVSDPVFEVALRLEEMALNDEYFVEKKLFPNVDFYSGVILSAIGFPTSMFTVLFALARTVGWVAQWNEMITDPDQKIGRPRQLYTGPTQRSYVPLAQR